MFPSSNILNCSYDTTTKTLKVNFMNGDKYHYHNVPYYVYDNLYSAKEKELAFQKTVKDAGYKFTKQ